MGLGKVRDHVAVPAFRIGEFLVHEPEPDMSVPKCANFELRPRPGRESHHGIVIDPAQGKLADAPVQREAIELRLGRIR